MQSEFNFTIIQLNEIGIRNQREIYHHSELVKTHSIVKENLIT